MVHHRACGVPFDGPGGRRAGVLEHAGEPERPRPHKRIRRSNILDAPACGDGEPASEGDEDGGGGDEVPNVRDEQAIIELARSGSGLGDGACGIGAFGSGGAAGDGAGGGGASASGGGGAAS